MMPTMSFVILVSGGWLDFLADPREEDHDREKTDAEKDAKGV